MMNINRRYSHSAVSPPSVANRRRPEVGLTRTLENLLREVAALLKQSAALKMRAYELFKTADKLRHKAEEMKDAPSEESKTEDRQ